MNTKEFCDWFMKRDPDPQAALEYLANNRKVQLEESRLKLNLTL